MLDRRQLLTGAALATPAAATAPMQGIHRPAVSRFKVGAFEVTTILDGAVQLPGPHPIFGQNVGADAVAALAEQNFLPADRMEIGFTVTVVNTGAHTVLFDTGNGGDTGRRPNAGLLLARLGHAGIAPSDIDFVVLTHFHGDHIGGMTEQGLETFPQAGYMIPAAEYDFWTQEGLASREGMAGRVALVNQKVLPFHGRTDFIKGGDQIVPGIEAIDAHGHTPGHTAYHIESEGQRLMLIADSCNHYVVSLQRPDWHVRFDMDKEAAARTRKDLLGMIAADRIPFVGYHMPFPAVGYLETHGEGFRYVPASYQLFL